MDKASHARWARLAEQREALRREEARMRNQPTHTETIPTGPIFLHDKNVARHLWELCYSDGWIIPDFDWPAWTHTREGTNLRTKRQSLKRASPEQVAKLLTCLVRQNRFCEGTWSDALRTGLLAAIAERAATLAG